MGQSMERYTASRGKNILLIFIVPVYQADGSHIVADEGGGAETIKTTAT
jgi:hypothetical protein